MAEDVIYNCEPCMPAVSAFGQEFRNGAEWNNKLWKEHIRELFGRDEK